MEVNVEQSDSVTILAIIGRLDGNTSEVLESRFLDLLGLGNQRFVFNMERLDYVSSAGLRIVLVAAKKLKAVNGKIALANLSENVKEVFDMSGFSSIFAIYPSVEAAMQAIG